MSLIKRSDVKNHLSTRTGDTTLPVQPSIDTGPSGISDDGTKDAAFASPGVSGNDGYVSSAPNVGKPEA